jgi:DNA adenine methylase
MDAAGLAPWYGAKRTMGPLIAREMGEHGGYCEPFCGSMAVLFAKRPASMEIANDLHRDLVNLARVVASPRWTELLGRSERTLMAAELYLEAKAVIGGAPCETAPSVREVGDAHLERAYWFLVFSWQGRNGVSGTALHNQHLARRFTLGGGHGPTRWRAVSQSLPLWHERLRQVTIEQLDAFDLVGRLEDSSRWVIYADPPYYRKGDKYLHDFTVEDHARLAALLRAKRETRVIVSYYDEPEIRALYEGWTIVKCPVPKAMVNQGMRDKKGGVTAPEILLINGPSLTAATSLFGVHG